MFVSEIDSKFEFKYFGSVIFPVGPKIGLVCDWKLLIFFLNFFFRQAVGGWKYRYLYVQMDDYPNDVIILQDNRAGENSSPAPSVGELKPIFSSTK